MEYCESVKRAEKDEIPVLKFIAAVGAYLLDFKTRQAQQISFCWALMFNYVYKYRKIWRYVKTLCN